MPRPGLTKPGYLHSAASGFAGLAVVAVVVVGSLLGAPQALAFEVFYNRPFAARCNGPMGAVLVPEPPVTASATLAQLRQARRSAVAAAVTTQHNAAMLARAARPLRLLAQRGLVRGHHRIAFPRPVVHVTSSQQIVLPDLVHTQQAGGGLGDPTNDLHFVFEGFDEGTEASLRDYLDTAMPVARNVYGPPAFDLTVKIINDPNVQSLQGGYYDVTANEIHLAPMTGNFAEDTFVLLKLVLHAFHDDTIFFFDAWEEGFAGAAATVIQTTPGVSPGYNPYDPGPFYALSVYEPQNQPPLGNPTFYPASGWAGMLVWRIAMARAAWMKCWVEDPSFFARFNAEYYRQYTPSLAGDTPGLKDIAASVLPQVEGQSFYEWYDRQYVLDTSVHTGPKMFTWNIPLTQSVALIVEHYSTDSNGNEQPLGGQALTIYWNYDFSVSLYAEEGNTIPIPASGEGAGEGFLIPTFFNIGGPQRITVQIDLNGLRAYYPYPYGMRGFNPGENNIYGAILGAISGEVDLDGPDSASGLAVSRGVWGTEIESGNLAPGQITVTYRTADGDETTRVVNVGWDSYVLFLRGGAHVTLSHQYAEGVHMMSLPLYTLNPSAPDVLGVPSNMLLLARWDPRLGGTGRYRLWPDIDAFAPGKAFWLKLFDDTTVNITGIPTDPDVDFPVPLRFGWNMVGVPRDEPVALADVRAQVGTDPSVTFEEAVSRHWLQASVFGYSMARGYEQVDTFQPWQGYWVRCLLTSEVRLLFPPATGGTVQASVHSGGVGGRGLARRTDPVVTGAVNSQGLADAQWELTLTARTPQGAGTVVMGETLAGATATDATPAPPAGPGGVRVCVVRAGGRDLPEPAYRSLLPRSGAAAEWEVLIQGPPGAEVELATELAGASEPPRVVLEPAAGGKAWVAPAQVEREAQLNSAGQLVLRVRAEPQPGTTGGPLLSCVTAETGAAGATVVYTLGRAATVQAEVLNIAGRRVKTLTAGTMQTAGQGTLRWNGTNQWGARVPAGLYLVSLEARSQDGGRQRAIVPLNLRRR